MLALTHTDELDPGPRKLAPGSERFCAATGTVKPIAEMIRFVVGPEGAPVADLKRRLPGRGIWITATRKALETAVARKAFARSFKREMRLPAGFVDTTERLIEQAAFDALAITRKAGKAVTGFAKVEAAVAHDPVAVLIHARDAGRDGSRKLQSAARHRTEESGRTIAVIEEFASAQLDLAFGRPNVVHAALLAGPESETFLARVERLRRFRADSPGDRGGDEARAEGARE